MGITFLGIIIIYDLFIRESNDGNFNILLKEMKGKLNKYKFIYSGYLAVSIIYLLLLFIVFKSPFIKSHLEISSSGDDLFQRIIYFPYLVFQYIKLAVWPLNLNVHYDFNYPGTFFSLINIVSYIVVFGLMAFSVFILKYSKKIFFGIWWFFITLLPVTNIIKIYDPFADRFMYFPLIGLCIIIGGFFTDLFERINIKSNKKQIIKVLLIISLFLFYFVLTVARNTVWKDPVSLWSDNIKKSPKKATGYINLGIEYLDNNTNDKAEYFLKKAVELEPNNAIGHFDLAECYKKKGLNADAVNEYLKAIVIYPNYVDALNNLGLIYKEEGKYEEAILQFKKAGEINLKYFDSTPFYNMGNTFFVQKRYKEAIELYLKVKEMDPKTVTQYII